MTHTLGEEIKDKVIDYINMSALGRLVIVKPEKKGFEDYLVVERKGKYREDAMYFSINSLVLPTKDADFVKDFKEKDFKIEKNFYLIFAYFNEPQQKINDLIWLIPSIKFREIADTVKSDAGEDLLRFESSLGSRENDKYSRFLVNVKTLGNLILNAFENKGNFDFKKMGIQEKRVINLDNLKDFLFNSRQETYISGSAPIESPQLSESKQYEFQKGNNFYRNIFFIGEKNIIGQEIIYEDLKPVFGMNYAGMRLEKLGMDFLKEALYKLSKKSRFNEICEYEKREYRYQCRGEGSFENFSGEEEIFLNGKSIYKLKYQGEIL